jgi:uncharacterized protein YacL (UPF0231 family)
MECYICKNKCSQFGENIIECLEGKNKQLLILLKKALSKISELEYLTQQFNDYSHEYSYFIENTKIVIKQNNL